MSQSPQRPYVPHRTPTRAQPAISLADFAVTRPFVPDPEQVRDVVFEAPPTVMAAAESTVPSIESFLAATNVSASSSLPDIEEELTEEPEDLPPLEHFLDPLPPISDFAATDEDEEISAANEEPRDDWVATDWQRYDWQSVAALGDTDRTQDEASNAWATTDWEVPAPRRSEPSKTPADAIASALDQIVQRLRNGDLSLPGGGVADPATIAATLAALLGVRR